MFGQLVVAAQEKIGAFLRGQIEIAVGLEVIYVVEAVEAAESAQQPADEVPLNADQMPSVADEAAEAPEDGGNE